MLVPKCYIKIFSYYFNLLNSLGGNYHFETNITARTEQLIAFLWFCIHLYIYIEYVISLMYIYTYMYIITNSISKSCIYFYAMYNLILVLKYFITGYFGDVDKRIFFMTFYHFESLTSFVFRWLLKFLERWSYHLQMVIVLSL